MTISLRLSEKESLLIKNYAEMNNLSVSELIRKSVLEKIEDEIDLDTFQKAYHEYLENPVSYSLEDVKKELQL